MFNIYFCFRSSGEEEKEMNALKIALFMEHLALKKSGLTVRIDLLQ